MGVRQPWALYYHACPNALRVFLDLSSLTRHHPREYARLLSTALHTAFIGWQTIHEIPSYLMIQSCSSTIDIMGTTVFHDIAHTCPADKSNREDTWLYWHCNRFVAGTTYRWSSLRGQKVCFHHISRLAYQMEVSWNLALNLDLSNMVAAFWGCS